MLRLIIHRGDKLIASVQLGRGLHSIGRGQASTIRLDDGKVSRNHALVTLDADGQCHLQDVGSKNGTLLAGQAVGRIRLQVGDRFTVGSHEFELAVDDAEAPASRLGRDPSTHAETTIVEGSGDSSLFIGTSDAARELLRLARRAAAARMSVLITGESGSGKGVIGQLIHRWSERSAGPFVAVNCAAIPANLVESELFGHRRGAFTGATSDHRGRFQVADKGTLFLDEIGDMSLDAQAKILRALEEGHVEPVGSTTPVPTDVRIIAATHRDLDAARADGRFRDDLFYRLATIRIQVPPLRERPDDVLLLANCCLSQLIDQVPMAAGSYFTAEAADALVRHRWPGNVRELRNVVAQALVVKDGGAIEARHLSLGAGRSEPAAPGPLTSLAEVEGRHIALVLEQCHGNISRAAEVLGIARKTLRERLSKLGIERPEDRRR